MYHTIQVTLNGVIKDVLVPLSGTGAVPLEIPSKASQSIDKQPMHSNDSTSAQCRVEVIPEDITSSTTEDTSRDSECPVEILPDDTASLTEGTSIDSSSIDTDDSSSTDAPSPLEIVPEDSAIMVSDDGSVPSPLNITPDDTMPLRMDDTPTLDSDSDVSVINILPNVENSPVATLPPSVMLASNILPTVSHSIPTQGISVTTKDVLVNKVGKRTQFRPNILTKLRSTLPALQPKILSSPIMNTGDSNLPRIVSIHGNVASSRATTAQTLPLRTIIDRRSSIATTGSSAPSLGTTAMSTVIPSKPVATPSINNRIHTGLSMMPGNTIRGSSNPVSSSASNSQVVCVKPDGVNDKFILIHTTAPPITTSGASSVKPCVTKGLPTSVFTLSQQQSTGTVKPLRLPLVSSASMPVVSSATTFGSAGRPAQQVYKQLPYNKVILGAPRSGLSHKTPTISSASVQTTLATPPGSVVKASTVPPAAVPLPVPPPVIPGVVPSTVLSAAAGQSTVPPVKPIAVPGMNNFIITPDGSLVNTATGQRLLLMPTTLPTSSSGQILPGVSKVVPAIPASFGNLKASSTSAVTTLTGVTSSTAGVSTSVRKTLQNSLVTLKTLPTAVYNTNVPKVTATVPKCMTTNHIANTVNPKAPVKSTLATFKFKEYLKGPTLPHKPDDLSASLRFKEYLKGPAVPHKPAPTARSASHKFKDYLRGPALPHKPADLSASLRFKEYLNGPALPSKSDDLSVTINPSAIKPLPALSAKSFIQDCLPVLSVCQLQLPYGQTSVDLSQDNNIAKSCIKDTIDQRSHRAHTPLIPKIPSFYVVQTSDNTFALRFGSDSKPESRKVARVQPMVPVESSACSASTFAKQRDVLDHPYTKGTKKETPYKPTGRGRHSVKSVNLPARRRPMRQCRLALEENSEASPYIEDNYTNAFEDECTDDYVPPDSDIEDDEEIDVADIKTTKLKVPSKSVVSSDKSKPCDDDTKTADDHVVGKPSSEDASDSTVSDCLKSDGTDFGDDCFPHTKDKTEDYTKDIDKGTEILPDGQSKVSALKRKIKEQQDTLQTFVKGSTSNTTLPPPKKKSRVEILKERLRDQEQALKAIKEKKSGFL